MEFIGLKCEYLSEPLGISVAEPRFSWKFTNCEGSFVQKAFQIIVSSSRDMAEKGEGDLWDSGRVTGNRQSHISYSGIKLKSGECCWWRVRIWDGNDLCSGYSGIAMFEIGLLEEADWKGCWIAGPKGSSGLLFRKAFQTRHRIVRARAYICGLGYYELYLNGEKVGDHVLDPGWTDYGKREIKDLLYPFEDKTSKRALYVTYDVTALLKKGENAVGVMLGNGWFNQQERNVEGKLWYGEPRFILQINIEYGDGSIEKVVSDTSWKYCQGPIVFNNIYFGEKYDARLEVGGWNDVKKDVTDWNNVREIEAPSGKLTAQMSPPDRVKRNFEPISIGNPRKGIYIFDLGQNFSGWVQLRAQGPEGTEITLRFAEEIDSEGMLDFESAGGKGQIQKDTYIMKGTGMEIYEPRFTWHTFRYVEITGYPGIPDYSSILGRMVHSDVTSVGSFECSDFLLNRINEMYVNTQLSNLHGGVPSDCPHRERLGYTGDGHITAEASIYNFDMSSFYTKWIGDISDSQNQVTGFVPHTAPFYGGGGGPAWGCAYIMNTWCMYLYYADREILRAHYTGMKKWMDYLNDCTQGGYVIRREEPGGWFLGDWCTPTEIKIPPELVNTFYYCKCTEIMADIAAILDLKDDYVCYKVLLVKIYRAFNLEFLNKSTGTYSIGKQGTDVFPLVADIVPDEYKEQVVKSLLANIAANDFHFDTGIFATPLMLQVLSDSGFIDIAYTMLTREGFPGYAYMLEKGATTLWECWDGSQSHCHPMFGGVSAWFYKTLAGINPDPKFPGFERIIFNPHVEVDLHFVKASVDTIRGRVAIEWRKTELGIEIHLDVPANCYAALKLPLKLRINKITETGKIIFNNSLTDTKEAAGNITASDSELVVEIGSGMYHYILTLDRE